MVVIKVPKTPKKAFDKNRPPNGLLQAQLAQLEAVVAGEPLTGAPTRARSARSRSLTEGGAANRVATLMQQLREKQAPPVPEEIERAVPRGADTVRRAKRKTAKRSAVKKPRAQKARATTRAVEAKAAKKAKKTKKTARKKQPARARTSTKRRGR